MPWVIHKGPGDKIDDDGGGWGFPGATECCEEDEKHFARHILKIQQSFSSSEPLEWVRLFIPPPWTSDGVVKSSVKTAMEPGHS